MKSRLFIASLIVLLSVAIYPSMEKIANAERGMTGSIDNVFGGEEILLIFGLFIALMIVVDGIDKLLWVDKKGSGNQKVTASKTEIEEKSESNSL